MYIAETPDENVYCCKPMNCPGHVQIFKNGLKSYRDLPLSIAEFGKVHRYEPSGALHGIMRVRHFTQDDAHIFCTEDQITEECVKLNEQILSIYRDFGFEDVRIKFSDRPEKRVGADEVWDKAEAALKRAIEAAGLVYELNQGEGAFYGPKLEYVLRDAIGRDWQCGTVQVDLNMPERLGAFYIGAGRREARAGDDPPRHVRLAGALHRHPHRESCRPSAALARRRCRSWWRPSCRTPTTMPHEVLDALKAAGSRVEADLRNEKINYKVREHSVAKVPVLLRRRQARGGGGDRFDPPARQPGAAGDARSTRPSRQSRTKQVPPDLSNRQDAGGGVAPSFRCRRRCRYRAQPARGLRRGEGVGRVR